MSEAEFYTDGFDELEKLLNEYSKKTSQENILNVMEKGAAALVRDIMALPKPRSDIRKAGYTHLLDTMSYRRNRGEIEVGWWKYYGPMVERGTHRAPKGSPHVRPTFERNKGTYNNLMIKELFG